MNVVLFTWNPDKWNISDRTWDRQIRQIQECGFLFDQWSTGNTTHLIQPGDIAFLLRQSRDRGIVAGGLITGTVFQELSWREDADEDDMDNFVEITWTSQVPMDQRLAVETLVGELPEVSWTRQASGTTVDAQYHDRLCKLWKSTLRNAGYPNESFPHPNKSSSNGNRPTNGPVADQPMIDSQAGLCAVCGVDSKDMYTVSPSGFLVQLQVTDRLSAVAVCPNCHYIASRDSSPARLEDLRGRLHASY